MGLEQKRTRRFRARGIRGASGRAECGERWGDVGVRDVTSHFHRRRESRCCTVGTGHRGVEAVEGGWVFERKGLGCASCMRGEVEAIFTGKAGHEDRRSAMNGPHM